MQEKTTLKQLYNQQNFLRILIFSFVTIMIWISFSLFRSQQTPQIPPELIKMALPLNPTINVDVISRIEQKTNFSDDDLSKFPIFSLVQDKTGGDSIESSDGTVAPTGTGVSPASQLSPLATPIISPQASPATEVVPAEAPPTTDQTASQSAQGPLP